MKILGTIVVFAFGMLAFSCCASAVFYMFRTVALRKPGVSLWRGTAFSPFNLLFQSSKLIEEALISRKRCLFSMLGFLICVLCFIAIGTWAGVLEGADDTEDVVKIPLNTIWATSMPGTRDLYELEKGTGSRNHPAPLSDDIAGALPFLPQGKSTGKGFAVVGTEKEALRNAHAVLTKKQQPRQSFPSSANVWLVFYSHSLGEYVHLDNVERRDKTIKVAYRFVPHETKQITAHFALIPLGKLPVGKYRVDYVRLPLEQKYVDKGFKSVDSQWNNRVVCQPFSFEIVK